MITKGEMWLDDDNFLAIGKDANYRTVAEVVKGDFDVDVKDNAKEFIRRWNSQPALLAACEESLDYIEQTEQPYCGIEEDCNCIMCQLEAAIKTAKEK